MTVTRNACAVHLHPQLGAQPDGAEAYLQQIAGDRFEVESAGLEPGKLNPSR